MTRSSHEAVAARRLFVAGALAVALLGLDACAKLFGPRATVVDVDLHAAPSLNPDDTGRASPLRLRFYELKSVSVFNGADFFSLYDHDRDVLGADLVVREEIQVEPGMQKKFTRKPGPDTKFIAVLAPYRDIDHAKWRAAIEVRANKTTDVDLDLQRLTVSLLPASKK
ncbi:MAG TPA: type VI secretion system lipoprotein TssJ [Burkholderiales bacterium]|nr:type VI secretion system lipoprotein TssJ [Burkholderiales bacterium]